MKKIIALLIIVFSILSFTACTTRKETNAVDIKFWTLQMGDYAAYIYQIIRDYEKLHPNIQITWIDVPFSEGEKRTLAAVMTDSPPDLINLNPDFSALLAQKGTLQEIDESALGEFNPDIINALKYNDKVYSIPWYATSAITIYNKELFEESGVIRLPRTYKELGAISGKIKEKTGAYVYLPTITENDTMVKILNKYGVEDDYMAAAPVFEMYKELYQKDLIPKESITFTLREALEQYMAGKIVFFQGGANFLTMIKENAPSIYEKSDVTEQIKGPVGQNDFSVMNFVIPKRAKYKKEALDFCLYLTNAEHQLELAKMTNVIATNNEVLEDSFYNDYSTLEAKARSISAKQIAKITPQLKQRRNQKEVNTLVNTAVQSALLNKDSIDNILKNLNSSLENLAE